MTKRNAVDEPQLGGARADTSPAGPADDDFDEEDTGAFVIDLRKLVISAFILWQIFAVTVWLLPEKGPRATVAGIVANYMMFTGCWQQWTMFAPNPAKLDPWVEARIDYGDGTHRMWSYPRMATMGFVQRYDSERWRKMLENAHIEDNKRMWPFLTRYAAIVNDRHTPGTYPMTVHLIRHYRYITPPGTQTPPFTAYDFYNYTYTVSPLKARARNHD